MVVKLEYCTMHEIDIDEYRDTLTVHLSPGMKYV